LRSAIAAGRRLKNIAAIAVGHKPTERLNAIAHTTLTA